MIKINFKDLAASYINRYKLTQVSGTTDTYDISPVRGTVTEQGTPVRAKEMNDLQDNVEAAINAIWQKIYPVGAIYISTSSTNPQTLFGGTWESIQGRFLLGVGGGYTAGSTGGEATHTLTSAEMPKHSHGIKFGGGDTDQTMVVSRSYVQSNRWWWSDASDAIVQEAGGSAAHNNMPPYLTVYMWKRTA